MLSFYGAAILIAIMTMVMVLLSFCDVVTLLVTEFNSRKHSTRLTPEASTLPTVWSYLGITNILCIAHFLSTQESWHSEFFFRWQYTINSWIKQRFFLQNFFKANHSCIFKLAKSTKTFHGCNYLFKNIFFQPYFYHMRNRLLRVQGSKKDL